MQNSSKSVPDTGHLHLVVSIISIFIPFINSTFGAVLSGLLFAYFAGLIALGRNELGARCSLLTVFAAVISLLVLIGTLLYIWVFDFVLLGVPG